jgi:3',5'-cyclic AMP phosphodiesterase CpdA
MRKIIQLSDLHFGRTNPVIVAALQKFIPLLHPDIVVVSGDLTQRARETEFREARAFLDGLPFPKIIVPGNHDVPLYNLIRRFYKPLRRFSGLIHPDAEPQYIDSEVAIIGLNTARPFVFKGGRVSRSQVKKLEATLSSLSNEVTKIVVTHHPLNRIRSHRTGFFGYSEKALELLMKSGIDLLLAGHLHVSRIGTIIKPFSGQARSSLQIQAGTATSLRYRGEVNAFNVLAIDGLRAVVDQYSWDNGSGNFTLSKSETFERGSGGWKARERK